MDDGEVAQVEPFIGLLGEYDFAKTGDIVAGNRTTSPGRLQSRLIGGVSLAVGPHILLRISFSYVGIGRANYSAWSANARAMARF